MTTPQQFRKTATVDAMRWTPDEPKPVTDWLDAGGCHYAVLDGGRLGVGTLESGAGLDRHVGKPGDWVLRGPSGEFYICDADVFAQTYEAVAS